MITMIINRGSYTRDHFTERERERERERDCIKNQRMC